MAYPLPQTVRSPRAHWTLIDVLYDGGEESYSIAVGIWDEDPVLAIRWNGSDETPTGNPQSRGLPTWFIMPEEFNFCLLSHLPKDKQTKAMAVLGARSARATADDSAPAVS
jgi:hypothetical protein